MKINFDYSVVVVNYGEATGVRRRTRAEHMPSVPSSTVFFRIRRMIALKASQKSNICEGTVC